MSEKPWQVRWPEHINAPYPELPPTLLGKAFILMARGVRRFGEWLDRPRSG